MKIRSRKRNGSGAFSVMEALVAAAIFGVVFTALYAGISSGFAVLQVTRENLRATQIMQEKMETIRLYRWEQINQAGFIPTNFTDVFYSKAQTSSGLTYTGSVTIAAAPLRETYADDMRMVTVELSWVSGNVLRTREMSTFVSRYGLQNYIY